MSRRKRRSDKLVHSRNLDEVMICLLESPRWKQKLLDLEPSDQIVIDNGELADQDDEAGYLVRRYQLNYILSVDADNECGDSDPAQDAKVFKLRAARHPSVLVYAEELLEDIGCPAS
jgi:hypothetical protein